MMQKLMCYDATNAGLVLSPDGIFSMITMIMSTMILRLWADVRWLIGIEGAIMALGFYWLVTLNLQAGAL
jgi:MFS transporter, DHA2 family, multidrug resistance protein